MAEDEQLGTEACRGGEQRGHHFEGLSAQFWEGLGSLQSWSSGGEAEGEKCREKPGVVAAAAISCPVTGYLDKVA